MPAGIVKKQPSELLDYAIDFTGRVEIAETLTLVGVTSINIVTGADSSTELVASAPPPAVVGKVVTFWLQAGTHRDVHCVTAKVESSGGRELEDDLEVYILEE